MAVDYTYISARLRAIEAELPDKAWFQRLARSAPESLVQLMREHYRGFERVSTLDEFEMGLASERASLLDLLTRLAGDEQVVSFLRSGYDFDNALYLIKARSMGAEGRFTDFGLLDAELYDKALSEGDYDRFPEPVRGFLAEAAARAEKDEPAAVQWHGENLKYRYLLGVAPDVLSKRYLRMKIDLGNIVTFVRLKRSDIWGERPSGAFLEGGTIGPDRFSSLLREPEEELHLFLQRSDYRRLHLLGLAKEAPRWKVESAARNFLLDSLDESRTHFFDISPLLFHVELRGRDEHIQRTILAGRLNGLPEEIIMEKVEHSLPS